MTRDISNSDDVIDSRDVIARIAELESERDDLQSTLDDLRAEYAALPAEMAGDQLNQSIEDASQARESWNDEGGAEWKVLTELAAEGEGSPDWQYGEMLIRASYFKEYAQELAEDCCPVSGNSEAGKILQSWPYRCIDWEQAARELQMNYMTVDFGDVEYLIRF